MPAIIGGDSEKQVTSKGRRAPMLAVALAACVSLSVGGTVRSDAAATGVARPGQADTVRIGLVLPLSGSPYLTPYGERVLQGARLALEHYERTRSSGPPVALVVRDNAGEATRAASLVADLERDGVVGIVGPLLDRHVEAASRARRDPSLVLVSPTAMHDPRWLPNVYSLNLHDTRGAEALAEYVLAAGFRRLATVYPRIDAYAEKAAAFRRVLIRGGAMLVGEMPYDSGTTTFGDQLGELARVGPQAIYMPAPERDVRQLAPQVAYYGLDTLGVQVLGDRGWAAPELRQALEGRYVEGVIATTPRPDGGTEVGWDDFVAAYERRYRRSLETRFPALGHDALILLLAALAPGWNSPLDVSQRVAGLDGVRGATGVLSVRRGRVTRRPFVVRITGGRAVPAPPPELMIVPTVLTPTDSTGRDTTWRTR